MFWTSINNKNQHFLKVVLSYITYESNLYLILSLAKITFLLFLFLFTLSLL